MSQGSKQQWQKLEKVYLELPKDTLIQVEKVEELRGEVRNKLYWPVMMDGFLRVKVSGTRAELIHILKIKSGTVHQL